MAWTAPRTWVADEIVTASILNSALRDNLLELDLHAHGGGSGSGTAALGNLVSFTMIDAAAVAAPGGTLSVVFTSGTQAFIRSGGGAARNLTDINHEHAIATNAIVGVFTATAAGTEKETVTHINKFLNTSPTLSTSTALTIGGTGGRGVALMGFYVVGQDDTGTGAKSVRVRLLREATALGTRTVALRIPTSVDAVNTDVPITVSVGFFDASASAGSVTYHVEIENTTAGAGSSVVYGRGLIVQEVKEN